MIAAIIAAVGLPVILACVLVAADIRSDLSGLEPGRPMADQTAALIGWPDLETADRERKAGRPISSGEALWHLPLQVRMLGYMMDGLHDDGYEPSRDGDSIEMFILLPEAGQFLHPAHRIPNQMVEIWLSHPVPFTYRRLVWVSGALARTPERRDSGKAVYAIKGTSVKLAVERDITMWFTP